jgi:hypothetical protein
MPRSFPDMKSLKFNAKMRKFRQPEEGESEDAYREAFADYMVSIDKIESIEIRAKHGWDQLPPELLLHHLLAR